MPSARASLHTLRPLLVEAERAELDVGGLFIDAGSVDLNKYTLGGWRTGWGDTHASAKGPSFISVDARAVSLRLVTHEVAQEIALRARSARAGQSVSVLVDGKSVGQADVGPDWSVGRVSLKGRGGLAPGAHEIGLVFKGESSGDKGKWAKSGKTGKSGKSGNKTTDSAGPRAELDWMFLAHDSGGEPPAIAARVAPLALGGRTQRALVAVPARTYSFYLEVPRNAFLLADYGADGAQRFVVRATTDGARAATLLEVNAAPDHWREAKVDLAPFAGQVIRLDLVSEGQSTTAGWGEPELMTPDPPASALASGPRKPAKNLIFLVMDTARADEFGPWRKDSPVRTPAYDTLAKEGTVFHATYANENWTKPSVTTLLSGLYPSTHGAKRDPDVLSDEVKLLPEYLKDAGFTTAAFIANGFISDKFGFKRGWDEYTNYIRENKTSDAEKVYGDALDWLESRPKDKRFFLYLQTIDPHVPYRVPEEYARKFHPEPYKGFIGEALDGNEQADISRGKKKAGPDDVAWMKALYHAEVTYHDTFMGQFFEALRKNKVLDDTLVVVTNDHGEELGDHGKYGHGQSLYDELIRSPLLMRYPPLFKAGANVETITELVDVMPTVLEVLGAKPAPDIDGTSLLPAIGGKLAHQPAYAVSEFLDGYRSVRVGRWKLITSAAGTGKMFDLASDHNEELDRAGDAPIARRLCDTLLGEALATPAKARRYQGVGLVARRRFRSGTVSEDPELKRQLKALGYLGG